MYFALRDVFASWRAGGTYNGCVAARWAVSAARSAGHIFWQSRRGTVRERERELGRETKNGVCSDAYATWDSAILLWR